MPVIDFNWILPGLAVGGRIAPEALPLISREGVRAVVDLREEEADDEALLKAHGIELLRLPTPDRLPPSLPMLDAGTRWVEQQRALSRPVLIHCQHGIGRSALLCLCVLVRGGYSPLSALTAAKEARAVISPSPEQLEQFRAWLHQAQPAAWQVPSNEDLFRIAYRQS